VRPHRIFAAAALVITVTACGGDKSGFPYEDRTSVGQIALFNAQSNPITKGNVNDKPFVAYAVSNQKAPPPYDQPGRTATLLAFLPRHGVAPTDWEGEFMTLSTPYSDANRPTASGAAENTSLADLITHFPPDWDGLLQLRIYLGAPGERIKTDQYASASIRVSGDTWSIIGDTPSIAGGPAGSEPTGGTR